jgi:predicted ATPase
VGRCVPEPAREVLAEQRATGGDGIPDRNATRFVDLLLQRSIENHRAASCREGATLFDRGVPDCVAYAEWLGADPGPSVAAARLHRYNPRVLVARPWEEIYGTDDERKMTYAATLEFHLLLERAYANAGYTLVEIPRGSIEDRTAFVVKFFGATVER